MVAPSATCSAARLSARVNGWRITVRVPKDRPHGTALSNARIITMGPAGTIEQGDLIIHDNRILAVGQPRKSRSADATAHGHDGENPTTGISDA